MGKYLEKYPKKYPTTIFSAVGPSPRNDYEQPVSQPNEEGITGLFRVHPADAFCFLFFRGVS